jgi:GTP-binding protein
MPLQLLITTLDYNDYVGRLAIGRVFNGTITRGKDYGHCRLDGTVVKIRVTALYGYDGLKRVEIDQAGPGDIVAVAGLLNVTIGESISDAETPIPLPPITVDEPTIAIIISTNDSPVAGLEGAIRHLPQASGAPLQGDSDERIHPGGGDGIAGRVQGVGTRRASSPSSSR